MHKPRSGRHGHRTCLLADENDLWRGGRADDAEKGRGQERMASGTHEEGLASKLPLCTGRRSPES